MSNMPYCRFRNTLSDLRDCYEHMDDDEIATEEQKARRKVILLAHLIADDYGKDDENV